MLRFLTVIIFAVAMCLGCGDDECEQACDKMKSCGMEVECTGDCGDADKVMAECVNSKPCEEVMQCFSGLPTQ